MTKQEELKTKIQSISESLSVAYEKPSTEKVEQFKKALEDSSRAQDYIYIQRGINKDTASNFNLGYDSERDAISIPVYERGELVNIRYRFLDPENKVNYTQEKGAEV